MTLSKLEIRWAWIYIPANPSTVLCCDAIQSFTTKLTKHVKASETRRHSDSLPTWRSRWPNRNHILSGQFQPVKSNTTLHSRSNRVDWNHVFHYRPFGSDKLGQSTQKASLPQLRKAFSNHDQNCSVGTRVLIVSVCNVLCLMSFCLAPDTHFNLHIKACIIHGKLFYKKAFKHILYSAGNQSCSVINEKLMDAKMSCLFSPICNEKLSLL